MFFQLTECFLFDSLKKMHSTFQYIPATCKEHFMNKTIQAALLALLLALPITSVAAEKKVKQDEKLDMATYTCADLLAESEDEVGMILLWVDGYLSGKTGDTVINTTFVGELAEKVGEKCGKDGKAKLMDVVKELTE
jgi:acid stress chaperone HdeB